MADKSNDPVAIWQNLIGEMEKGFNSFANQAMTSPEFGPYAAPAWAQSLEGRVTETSTQQPVPGGVAHEVLQRLGHGELHPERDRTGSSGGWSPSGSWWWRPPA